MDVNQSTILFCAFRYALGRNSYVVNYVVPEIHRNWESLMETHKEIFVKEILEKQKLHDRALDTGCDVKEWMSIVERFNNERSAPGDPMFGGLMKE